MPAEGEYVIDDRLATVLATQVSGVVGQRIQYRQLIDLLGRMPPDFALPGLAVARLDELSEALSAADRARIVHGTPASLRHPGLILRLAARDPAVAAAAIAAARLDDWQWSALIAELPLAARGYVRHRRDLGPKATAMLARFGIGDLGLPSPEGAEDPVDLATSAPPIPTDAETSDVEALRAEDGIGAIVRRIEAFRRSRQAGTRQFGDDAETDADAPRLPLGDAAGDGSLAPASTIRFASNARGRIAWADDAVAAALVGLPFGGSDPSAPARFDRASARAIRQRRPFREGRVTIEGSPQVSGVWRIDAAPQFDAAGGRFIGYRGLLRRPTQVAAPADDPADRLRQLLHELRTPINAIQGYAELIQQQVLGPAPHQYRSLAAGIAADSAAILSGFDEIDLLVRLETGQSDMPPGSTDLASLVERLAARLAPSIAARGVRLELDTSRSAPVALAEAAAERVVWRLLATIAAAADPEERIAIAVDGSGPVTTLWIDVPLSLRSADPADLFRVMPITTGSPLATGLLGSGFAFRLAKAEARAAGGALELDGERLRLRLPTIPPLAGGADLTPRADANSPFATATAYSTRSGR